MTSLSATDQILDYFHAPLGVHIRLEQGKTAVVLDDGSGDPIRREAPEGATSFLIDPVAGCIDFYDVNGTFLKAA